MYFRFCLITITLNSVVGDQCVIIQMNYLLNMYKIALSSL